MEQSEGYKTVEKAVKTLKLKKVRPSKKLLDTTEYVVLDIIERKQLGIERYGKTLNADTKEDMLQHAYEEALDLALYLKTEILKRAKDE